MRKFISNILIILSINNHDGWIRLKKKNVFGNIVKFFCDRNLFKQCLKLELVNLLFMRALGKRTSFHGCRGFILCDNS